MATYYIVIVLMQDFILSVYLTIILTNTYAKLNRNEIFNGTKKDLDKWLLSFLS